MRRLGQALRGANWKSLRLGEAVGTQSRLDTSRTSDKKCRSAWSDCVEHNFKSDRTQEEIENFALNVIILGFNAKIMTLIIELL